MIFAVEELHGIAVHGRVGGHEHVHLAGHDEQAAQLVQAREDIQTGILLVAGADTVAHYFYSKAQFRQDDPDAAHAPFALHAAGRPTGELEADVVLAQGLAAPAVQDGVVIAHARGEVHITVRDDGIAAVAETLAALLVAAAHVLAHDRQEAPHVDGAGATGLDGGIEHAGQHFRERLADDVLGRDAAGLGILEAAAEVDDIQVQRHRADQLAGRAHAAFGDAVGDEEHLAVAFFMGVAHDVVQRGAVGRAEELGVRVHQMQGHDVAGDAAQQDQVAACQKKQYTFTYRCTNRRSNQTYHRPDQWDF